MNVKLSAYAARMSGQTATSAASFVESGGREFEDHDRDDDGDDAVAQCLKTIAFGEKEPHAAYLRKTLERPLRPVFALRIARAKSSARQPRGSDLLRGQPGSGIR